MVNPSSFIMWWKVSVVIMMIYVTTHHEVSCIHVRNDDTMIDESLSPEDISMNFDEELKHSSSSSSSSSATTAVLRRTVYGGVRFRQESQNASSPTTHHANTNKSDDGSGSSINNSNKTTTTNTTFSVRKCKDGSVQETQTKQCATPEPTPTPTEEPTPKPVNTSAPVVVTTYRKCDSKTATEVQTKHCGGAPTPPPTPTVIGPIREGLVDPSTVHIVKRIQGMVKSRGDERTYRRFQMSNGLDVLLVSDANATKAAAAMDVNVGYWEDPEDIAGLAHFCEHMLFLGTKKYPKEDEYSAYLSANGGSSNAYTSYTNTNFYFDIQPRSFEGALDRFSQFFIAPLFTQSSTGREMKAVNAEHVKNIQSDGWRTFQMIQSLASKSVPFHKFGTGNSETLGSVSPEKLRQSLLNFWKKHYLAYNMRLVVLGHEGLEELEKYVIKYFAAVPSDRKDEVPHRVQFNDDSARIFPPNTLPSLIHSESVKDSRSLIMTWYIPPQTPLYGLKSHDYVSTLLGNEARGSLLSILKTRGLASGLTAGSELSTNSFDLYQVSVDLTVKGFTHESIREIQRLTFRYIKLIESQGVQQWRWKEMGKISAIHFRLKNKEESQDYVSKLASTMPKFKSRDLLMAKYLFERYDESNIRQFLSYLQPEKMMVVVSAQHPPQGVNLTHTERFYGVKFSVEALPNLVALRSARDQPIGNQSNVDVHERMVLPKANPFIPSSLDVKKLDNANYPDYPVLIKDYNEKFVPSVVVNNVSAQLEQSTGSVRVFYHQDRRFSRPRVNVICKIWSRELYSSPRDVVLASLFTKLVRDHLNELAYQAGAAGYSFSFGSDVDGYDLRITGYDSGLVKFVRKLSKYLMMHNAEHPKAHGFIPLQRRFALIKEELAQSYRNFMFGQPHVHSSYGISLLLENPHWHISQYIASIVDIQLSEVIIWSRGVYTDAALDCLVDGNVYESEALLIVNAISSNVIMHSDFQADRRVNAQVQRVTQLDGSYTFTMKTPNPHDLNSAAYAYYQYEGDGNMVDDMLVEFLSQVMEKPCFHQLRTVEQLGYIVWSGVDKRAQVTGMRIIVQSPKRSAAYLNSRINAFVHSLRALVRKMTKEHFDEVRHMLIHQKKQPPRTLADQSAHYWYEVVTQQYLWTRREKEADVLSKISMPQFWKFFDVIMGYSTIPSRIGVLINAQIGPGAAVNKTNHTHVGTIQKRQSKVSKAEVQKVIGAAVQKTLKHRSVSNDRSLSNEMDHAVDHVAKVLNENDAGVDKHSSLAVDTDEDGFDVPRSLRVWDISDEDALPANDGNSESSSSASSSSSSSSSESSNHVDGELEGMANDEFAGLAASDDEDIDESLLQYDDAVEKTKIVQQPVGVSITHPQLTVEGPVHKATQPIGASVYYVSRVEATKRSLDPPPKPLPLGNTVPVQAPVKPNATPRPTLSPIPRVPADPTCNKSGKRRVYRTRKLNLVNIAAFKDAMCLFPRRPVGVPATKKDFQSKSVPKKPQPTQPTPTHYAKPTHQPVTFSQLSL